ncbi:PREDICTED: uncharacterized protein LOC105364736 [Ceratosolen solmsi marchali]|uniref:Uncharacterized protein LOC105364736 n=1 Tax=Ceratosolen solmsi marchali TaxID=326594 RepID=A0AAJ7DYF9_9HYME|nr:PREDICTED: uncharacterized protein LOC105364736 [Ceratosolen solmsi marchali]
MMTAMTRLSYKQTSPSQQSRYSSSSGTSSPSFAQSRGYWEMQQSLSHPAPPYVRSHHRLHVDHGSKRKSAVELLQESKAFYVKSETVLDRKQELKNSGHLQVSQVTVPGAPPRLLRKCGTSHGCPVLQQQQPCCWTADCDRQERILSPQRTLPPALPPKSPRLVSLPQRRSALGSNVSGISGAEQLQAKLRRLLNIDSKENVFFAEPEMPGLPIPSEYTTPQMTNNNASPSQPIWEKFRYSPGGIILPGCKEDDFTVRYIHLYLILANHFISDCLLRPRFKFGRSNSHSHGVRSRCSASGRSSSAIETAVAVSCHKSLPNLHTSTRRWASLSPRTSSKASRKVQLNAGCLDCETGSDYSDGSFNRDSVYYRSSRHIKPSMGSVGGDTSSILSSGDRTHLSMSSSKLSHGATARDSGSSSGHCTHKSDPSPKIQDCWSRVRRDSGASAQYSTEKDKSRKRNRYNNRTPATVVRNYSPETDSSNSQTDYSPTCNSRFSDGWKEGRGRPILRSKSDISERYWRQDGGTRAQKLPAQPPRSITQLESFFDRLGLEQDNYQHITKSSSKASSPVFFDSVSSVESALGLYLSWTPNGQGTAWPNCSAGNTNNDECPGGSQKSNDQPSIVERNARIIKWLCQCRKVQFGYS